MLSDFFVNKLSRITPQSKKIFSSIESKGHHNFQNIGEASAIFSEQKSNSAARKELQEKTPVFRYVKAEGNSFYRAFGFTLLETLFYYSYSCQESKVINEIYMKRLMSLLAKLDQKPIIDICDIESIKNEKPEFANLTNIQITLSDLLVLLAEFCYFTRRSPDFPSRLSNMLENAFNFCEAFDFGVVLFMRVLAKEAWLEFNLKIHSNESFKDFEYIEKNVRIMKNIEIFGAEAEDLVLMVLAYHLKIKLKLFYYEEVNESNTDRLITHDYNFMQESEISKVPEIPIFFKEGLFSVVYLPYLANLMHKEVGFGPAKRPEKASIDQRAKKIEVDGQKREGKGHAEDQAKDKGKVRAGDKYKVLAEDKYKDHAEDQAKDQAEEQAKDQAEDQAKDQAKVHAPERGEAPNPQLLQELIAEELRFVRDPSRKLFRSEKPFEENPLLISVKPAKATICEKEVFKNSNLLKSLVDQLKDVMPVFRGIRGDGNCFYRAFAFGLLENLYFYSFAPNVDSRLRVEASDKLNRLVAKIKNPKFFDKCDIRSLNTKKKELKNPLHVINVLKELLLLLIEFCIAHKSSKNFGKQLTIKLENLFNCVQEFDIGMILLIRSIAEESWQVMTSDHKYDSELRENLRAVEEFTNTRKDILKYGTEAEETVMVVLASSLRIFIKLFYIERNQRDSSNPRLLTNEFAKDQSKLQVVIYFRPGHYDAGYTKELAFDMHPELIFEQEAYQFRENDQENAHNKFEASGKRTYRDVSCPILTNVQNPQSPEVKARLEKILYLVKVKNSDKINKNFENSEREPKPSPKTKGNKRRKLGGNNKNSASPVKAEDKNENSCDKPTLNSKIIYDNEINQDQSIKFFGVCGICKINRSSKKEKQNEGNSLVVCNDCNKNRSYGGRISEYLANDLGNQVK